MHLDGFHLKGIKLELYRYRYGRVPIRRYAKKVLISVSADTGPIADTVCRVQRPQFLKNVLFLLCLFVPFFGFNQ
mgnify:CR=1 FL=1